MCGLALDFADSCWLPVGLHRTGITCSRTATSSFPKRAAILTCIAHRGSGVRRVRKFEEVPTMPRYVREMIFLSILCRSITYSIGIMGASTMILFIVSPINVALNIYFIHYTRFGLLGSPIAVSITYWLCFCLLGVYTYFSTKHRENGTWGGLQPRAVFDLRSCYEFLKLALPGILMVGTEWYDSCQSMRTSSNNRVCNP